LPGNLNISFPRVESEALMIALKNDVAVSSGSACTTAAVEPSHVLSAIGCSEEEIHASIRFGLGRSTQIAEVDYVSNRVVEEVLRLCELRA
jgi:cysteine desulfurase